jgi:hypothetical protein
MRQCLAGHDQPEMRPLSNRLRPSLLPTQIAPFQLCESAPGDSDHTIGSCRPSPTL